MGSKLIDEALSLESGSLWRPVEEKPAEWWSPSRLVCRALLPGEGESHALLVVFEKDSRLPSVAWPFERFLATYRRMTEDEEADFLRNEENGYRRLEWAVVSHGPLEKVRHAEALSVVRVARQVLKESWDESVFYADGGRRSLTVPPGGVLTWIGKNSVVVTPERVLGGLTWPLRSEARKAKKRWLREKGIRSGTNPFWDGYDRDYP